MTSGNPQPRFGGWYSYREWADHGFVARDRQDSLNWSEPEDPPPDALEGLPDGPVNAPVYGYAENRDAERADRPGAEPDEVVQGRTAAAHLALLTPGWYLMYGPASRKIWAYPTSPYAPKGLVLADQDPARLHALIKRAEREFGFPLKAHAERSAHSSTTPAT